MEYLNLSKVTNVYFIGVGGVSMSALANFLSLEGYNVSGSDMHYDEYALELLRKNNVKTYYGHNKANIENIDIVIYSSAITENNPEYVEALDKKIPLISRQELLSSIACSFERSFAVAGSHGKTTATAILTHIFGISKNPTAHIGGFDKDYDNLLYGGKEIFVTESCEYKKNFLKLKCHAAVVLNIDKDHLECYNGFEDLVASFKTFLSGAKLRVVNADDENLQGIEGSVTFALENSADYRAENIRNKNGHYSFVLNARGKRSRRIFLNVMGKHNVYNALAAAAVSIESGVDIGEVCEGIEAFKGVRRRAEFIGNINGAAVYADYAHHPKELEASIKTFKKLKYRKLYILFQPHTYSRTRLLMKEFIKVLNNEGNVLIYSTYPARECFDPKGSGYALKDNLGAKALYFDGELSLLEFLAEKLRKKDLLLVLGAGDIYEKMCSIIEEIDF